MAPSLALLFCKQGPLLVTSVSVSAYCSLLDDVFGILVALMHSLDWDPHDLHQYVGPSASLQNMAGTSTRYLGQTSLQHLSMCGPL